MKTDKKETEQDVEGEWVEVRGGDYIAWTLEGTSVVGKFLGFEDGTMGGKLGKLEAADGTQVTISCPAILQQKLTKMVGQTVKITYVGAIKFQKSGRTGKNFSVVQWMPKQEKQE
jgi:hypothetical protein